jgi:hypothetical protein
MGIPVRPETAPAGRVFGGSNNKMNLGFLDPWLETPEIDDFRVFFTFFGFFADTARVGPA